MDTLTAVATERERQIEAAMRRYEAGRAHREEMTRHRAAGAGVAGRTPDLEARAVRLAHAGQVPVSTVAEVTRAAEPDRDALLERIIGASADLCAVSFLPRGARAAAPVARISVEDGGRALPLGTGFLASPRLLMTNNHVLPDAGAAATVVVEFGAEVDVDNLPLPPVRYRLAPEVLFLTDPHLDYSLVAVMPGADGRVPGELFGWEHLVAQRGKIVIGEPVNIVGHPSGRLKEISVRNNRVLDQLEDFLHYETDTEPGNSGSPVFNDQWEVVALHHSGVPRRDEQGQVLRRDGRVWAAGDGDDAIDWVANEGARISAVLAHLATQQVGAAGRELLGELGRDAGVIGPRPTAPALRAAVPAPAIPPLEAATRRGLAARTVAFGGTKHLVYLHGRGQAGRDPERLRRAWTGGLNRGLTLAGLAPVDPADAWFPFYGDVLASAVHAREGLVPPSATLLYADMIAEAAKRAGMPASAGLWSDLPAGAADAGELATITDPELLADAAAESGVDLGQEGLAGFGAGIVSRLQPQLSWLAARSGLDAAAIAALFRDVAAYLDQPAVRRAVLDAVKATLPAEGHVVLVAHSLGTVVAMDLLTELRSGLTVDVLVTAGSPLGLDTVQDRLLTCGPHRPEVGTWFNAWCAADPVAIGCPLRDDWRGQLEEVVVANSKDHAHDIAEYLAHGVIARSIGRGLA